MALLRVSTIRTTGRKTASHYLYNYSQVAPNLRPSEYPIAVRFESVFAIK